MNTSCAATTVKWVKSTYSNGDGGDCIEWSPTTAAITHTIPVRDSKTPHGPVLLFPEQSWTPFVTALRTGTLA